MSFLLDIAVESYAIYNNSDIQAVRLLVSASPNQPANSVFLSQQISTSQLKPAQKLTSEQAANVIARSNGTLIMCTMLLLHVQITECEVFVSI